MVSATEVPCLDLKAEMAVDYSKLKLLELKKLLKVRFLFHQTLHLEKHCTKITVKSLNVGIIFFRVRKRDTYDCWDSYTRLTELSQIPWERCCQETHASDFIRTGNIIFVAYGIVMAASAKDSNVAAGDE